MLVISRRIQESIIVNDVLVVTVTDISDGTVELSLATIEGGVLRTLFLNREEYAPVCSGVRVCLIECSTKKVRLGIEYPPQITIARHESHH